VTENVSDPVGPHSHISRSAKAVESAGYGQVKGQALGLKTAEQMVCFYLKAEFRTSKPPCKKLTLAEQHHSNKQARSLRVSSISCTMRIRSKAGHVCQGQQDAGSAAKVAGLYSRCLCCLPTLVVGTEPRQQGKRMVLWH